MATVTKRSVCSARGKRRATSTAERTALSRQPDALLAQELASLRQNGELHPGLVLKDPYVLEFLDLPESHRLVESRIEEALISQLQAFLLELGKGFAFVARQQRISTESKDFYIDLVFYNYLLKCFVLIDLKSGPLTHQDVGQMDMYVRMYDDLRRGEGDNPQGDCITGHLISVLCPAPVRQAVTPGAGRESHRSTRPGGA